MYRFLIYLLFFTLFPVVSLAQSHSALQLETNPSYPQPGETYTVSVRASTETSPRSNIIWYINGTQKTELSAETTITLQAEDTPTRVTAQVTLASGEKTEVSRTISPYRIDLVVNANTYTPYFYAGRKLPSSGSDVTVRALVFKNNTQVQSGLSYLWKVGNSVQNGGAVQGADMLSFSPSFETEIVVSVDIVNTQGEVLGHETRVIPLAEPELYFYERNPLRGLLPTALHDPYTLIGDEMNMRAEAYFIDDDLASGHAFAQWYIDGKEASFGEVPQEITLRKEGNSGTSKIMFNIRNLDALLQGVKKTITVRF